MTIKRASIAADDALHYAATHNDRYTYKGFDSETIKEADKKFRKVVHLLEKDFLSKGPTYGHRSTL